jgi:riboflavin-specific deaminase-like protein
MRRQLPFVYLNVAMTADGKLAPANRQFVSFGSKRDRELLLELRTRADAVMSGARTVDASPVTLGPGPAKYRRLRLQRGRPEYNLRVIVSGSGTINPGAEVFKHRFSPIIILTTRRAGKNRLAKLRDLADEVKICGEREIDFIEALRWLRKKWQVTRLLCEGGGEVNGALFREGLVQEVYVTVCPLILGGRTAPTLADGHGVEVLAKATQLELKSAKRADGEMYLIYEVKKTGGR